MIALIKLNLIFNYYYYIQHFWLISLFDIPRETTTEFDQQPIASTFIFGFTIDRNMYCAMQQLFAGIYRKWSADNYSWLVGPTAKGVGGAWIGGREFEPSIFRYDKPIRQNIKLEKEYKKLKTNSEREHKVNCSLLLVPELSVERIPVVYCLPVEDSLGDGDSRPGNAIIHSERSLNKHWNRIELLLLLRHIDDSCRVYIQDIQKQKLEKNGWKTDAEWKCMYTAWKWSQHWMSNAGKCILLIKYYKK